MTAVTPHPTRPMDILLIEDNLGDIELTREALNEGKIVGNLYIARDGEEAMDYLQKKGKHAAAAWPDLILLDLNLPKKDGREVLGKIKQDPVLRIIPVIVLTSSEAEKDITTCYMLHANCYIVKPTSFSAFAHVVKMLEAFWLQIVQLPQSHRPFA